MTRIYCFKVIVLDAMKLSFLQFCIAVVFSGLTLGNDRLLGQSLLQKKVSLRIENNTLKSALSSIEKSADIRFIYNPNEIKSSEKIRFAASNESLEDVLNKLLDPLSVRYEVAGTQIMLFRKPNIKFSTARGQEAPSQVQSSKFATITGKVQDQNGQVLPGVSIIVKGTQTGTTTDGNGSYALTYPLNEGVLIFSFVGFISQEIPIGSQTNIDVTMVVDTKALEEIVVVGYGTQKKVSVTGAVASVSSKQLQQSAVANLSTALAGRLPGLITVQNSGEPGADAANIWIRGFGTFNSGAQGPLILVDGIERSFNGIDANEVDNITILKDASSTAVFGVRGANGVVLVTTKRGSNEKPRVSFSLQNGYQSSTRVPEYLDSYNALHLYREGLINDGLNANLYTDEYIEKFRDRSNPTYHYLYPNTDWMKELLKPYSTMAQTNLNVSGGSKSARYFVSLSYMKQKGLYKFEDKIKDYDIQAVTNKYNFRSNVDLDITKDLSMELNLGAIIRDRNYPGTSADLIFTSAKSIPAWWYPLDNPDGSISGMAPRTASPYGLLTQSGYQRLFENTVQATTGFKLKMPWITPGLSARARLSFDVVNTRNVSRIKSYSTYQYVTDENQPDLSKGQYLLVGSAGNNTLSYDVSGNGTRRTVVEAYLNYDRDFGKHGVNLMGLYNQQSYFLDIGSGQANAVKGLPFKYQGYVGRAAYAYDDRYLAEFNFGFNGSENFPAGKRFGFFPAVSVGWVISNESFMRHSDAFSFVNLLKLRASVGDVGNDRYGNLGDSRFLYLSTWSLTGAGYRFGQNYNGDSYSGAIESATGNPNVTWERARKINIGLELGLWQNAVSFTADVFSEHRVNILTTPQTLPAVVGIVSSPLVNAGVVDNKGFELVLEHKKNIGEQGYYVRANYSFARNKIINIAEPAYTGREWQARTGRRVGELYGLTAIGLFNSQEEINASPVQTAYGITKPGDIKYKDINGDGAITNLDQGYLNKVNTPEAMFGVSLGYHYKGFDLSVLFQGALGGSVWLTGISVWPFSRYAGVLSAVQDNYWTPENPDQNAMFPRMTSNDNANNYQNSSFWVYSNNYLRLKNAEIGYSFPKKLIKKIGFDNARIYVNGVNLLTRDKIKIFDPEIPNGTGNYPQQKVLNAGLTFSF